MASQYLINCRIDILHKMPSDHAQRTVKVAEFYAQEEIRICQMCSLLLINDECIK